MILARHKIRADWEQGLTSSSIHKIHTDWNAPDLSTSIPKIHTDWNAPDLSTSIPKIYSDWGSKSMLPNTGNWDLPLDANSISRNLKLNAEQKRFREATFPLSGDYESEVPTLFLHRLPDLKILKKFGLVVARDGALPLTLFFEKYKKPKGFEGKIAVEQSLIQYVPTAWKKHISSYRLVAGPNSTTEKNVFIYGINSAALLSLDRCESLLELAKPTLESAHRIYLCLPNHYLSPSEPIKRHTEIARLIFSKIGTDIEVADWGQFLQNKHSKGCQIVDLNKRTLIADCWLTHALMQRGGTLVNSENLGAETFYAVSASHGFAITRHPVFPRNLRNVWKKDRTSLLSSFEYSVFNWSKLSGFKGE